MDQMDTDSEHFDNMFYHNSKIQELEEKESTWNNLIKINEKLEKKALLEREELKKAKRKIQEEAKVQNTKHHNHELGEEVPK